MSIQSAKVRRKNQLTREFVKKIWINCEQKKNYCPKNRTKNGDSGVWRAGNEQAAQNNNVYLCRIYTNERKSLPAMGPRREKPPRKAAESPYTVNFIVQSGY